MISRRPTGQAAGLFETALTIPGIDRWPFDLARVQLAYGALLRRTRALTVLRAHLTAALETAERLDSQSFPPTEIWRSIEMSENTAGKVSNGMLLAAAEAVAGQADVSAPDASLLSAVENPHASSATTAVAVARATADDGVATRKADDLVQAVREAMWQLVYPDSVS